MLKTVYESLQKNPSEMATATFSVKSEWNGGFSVTSSSKAFVLVVKPWKEILNIK